MSLQAGSCPVPGTFAEKVPGIHACFWYRRVEPAAYRTLPSLSEVEPGEADIAWMIYDLQYVSAENHYQLVQNKIAYTKFGDALDCITRAEPGPIEDFIGDLQQKLDEKLEDGDSAPPDAPTLQDIIRSGETAEGDR